MLWICCRFSQLALEVFATAQEQQAVAVLHGGNGKQGLRIFQCNNYAAAMGLQPDMAVATAFSLCTSLICRERQPDWEQERLLHIAAIAYGFSPNVSLLPPDCLLIECSGSLRLFGGLPALLKRLTQEWKSLAHHCELGFANTPLAAEVLTKARIRLPFDLNTLPERTQRALASVRLPFTGWDEHIIERFASSGIHTLGQVVELPRASLSRRFGSALLNYLDRLSSARVDLRKQFIPTPQFATGVHFLEDITHVPGLIFPMRRLVQELSSWLSSRQLAADQIEWRFLHERYDSVNLPINLAKPSADPKKWLTLSRMQLEQRFSMQGVSSVQLHCDQPRQHHQHSAPLAFVPGQLSFQKPEDLLDLLTARFSRDVYGLGIGDDHRPEFGTSHQTAVWHDAEQTVSLHHKTLHHKTLHQKTRHQEARFRPLWLVPVPRRISVRDYLPLKGPERIDTAWWIGDAPSPEPISVKSEDGLGHSFQRDYYIACNSQGVVCWIFHAINTADWYLHGYFG